MFCSFPLVPILASTSEDPTMIENIENSLYLVRAELNARGIKSVPTVGRAMRYERFNSLGETSEVWYTVDFESVPCDLEHFTGNASATKHNIDEFICGEFETACETVRYSIRIVHYWTPEELETLRNVGKLIKVQEPATEYDALVC